MLLMRKSIKLLLVSIGWDPSLLLNMREWCWRPEDAENFAHVYLVSEYSELLNKQKKVGIREDVRVGAACRS